MKKFFYKSFLEKLQNTIKSYDYLEIDSTVLEDENLVFIHHKGYLYTLGIDLEKKVLSTTLSTNLDTWEYQELEDVPFTFEALTEKLKEVASQ